MYSSNIDKLGENPVLNEDLWRSPYARPRGFYHPVVCCTDASRTRQEFLKDSMIGSIMDRYKVTGQLPGINANRPIIKDGCRYPDDFQSGMNGLTRVQEERLTDPDVPSASEPVSEPVSESVSEPKNDEVKE